LVEGVARGFKDEVCNSTLRDIIQDSMKIDCAGSREARDYEALVLIKVRSIFEAEAIRPKACRLSFVKAPDLV
jgi:hypothetical protein